LQGDVMAGGGEASAVVGEQVIVADAIDVTGSEVTKRHAIPEDVVHGDRGFLVTAPPHEVAVLGGEGGAPLPACRSRRFHERQPAWRSPRWCGWR
jgi:hypothetical protein